LAVKVSFSAAELCGHFVKPFTSVSLLRLVMAEPEDIEVSQYLKIT
jgi:hypothetical protein